MGALNSIMHSDREMQAAAEKKLQYRRDLGKIILSLFYDFILTHSFFR
jgi:hypothetical protein